jgi:ferredoxin
MSQSPITYFLSKPELQGLIEELRRRDFEVVGPTIDQNAILYSEILSVAQLPQGWTDQQAAGHYRLERREDAAWFGFVVGPHSWKKYLFPPKSTLLSVQQTERGWEFLPPPPDLKKFAFLGVRACELAAIRIQDRVFIEGTYHDPLYRDRRESVFLIAVNCTQAASTCFCVSMETGPRCNEGYDLSLTEIDSGFLCEIGTTQGQEVLSVCNIRPANSEELDQAANARQRAVDQMTRPMQTQDLPQILMANLNHPRWKEVGERCLSCANCTLVCPTCFCSSVTEIRDLNTGSVDRERSWDSCFNPDFCHLSEGPVRAETSDRYRQWLTHKLGSWHEQFGSSGCVGCGRCITWCPVAIDIREEVAALREGEFS